MQIIKWEHGEGQTIQLSKEEAKELRYLLNKALIQGRAESGFIEPPTEVKIIVGLG